MWVEATVAKEERSIWTGKRNSGLKNNVPTWGKVWTHNVEHASLPWGLKKKKTRVVLASYAGLLSMRYILQRKKRKQVK